MLTKVVDFTKEDLDKFGITDLRSTDFIEAGGSYFKPLASPADVLANPALAEALLQKTEFTQQEWDAFGVDGLRMHHYVKSGDSFFHPAGETQPDVRVLRPIDYYGDFGDAGRLRWGVGDEVVVGEAFTFTVGWSLQKTRRERCWSSTQRVPQRLRSASPFRQNLGCLRTSSTGCSRFPTPATRPSSAE
jgi:hypothetical protein